MKNDSATGMKLSATGNESAKSRGNIMIVKFRLNSGAHTLWDEELNDGRRAADKRVYQL